MGKYMKKSKITGDVAVMELSVSQSTTSGVRTRARTLALQRLQSSSDSTSYLQLRSRRLEKQPLLQLSQAKNTPPSDSIANVKKDSPVSRGSSRLRVKSGGSDCEEAKEKEREGCFGESGEMFGFQCGASDFGAEASFGENCLDFEGRGRGTRESTPCSLISGSDTIGTPGSTTRQTRSSAANRRVRNDVQRKFPTAHELEEFFAYAEQQQQRLFIEKYNFDVVNDLPLPGRFEWVQVVP